MNGSLFEDIMADKSDPTKDPKFQKVIRHFVTTPHKPHAPIGAREKKAPLAQSDREDGAPIAKAKPSKDGR